MSRLANNLNASNGVSDDSGGNSRPSRDECPVCHTKRFMRQDMRFKINPECYHEMCDSCVDRLFSNGMRRCPYPGCGKMLKKANFRAPTFQDMQIEQEVDVRKRVFEVFNQREEDFVDLRTYNDYLNEVEDLIYNWLHVDAAAAQKRLDKYRDAHEDIIIENSKRAQKNKELEKQAHLNLEMEAQRMRLAARQEDMAKRQEDAMIRKATIDRLAAETGDAAAITQAGERALKAAGQRRSNVTAQLSAANGSDLVSIRGLKRAIIRDPEAPYDPFGGMSDVKDFVVIPQKPVPWNDMVAEFRKNKIYGAGGYTMNDFYNRALTDAFSGLDVFVKTEKARDRKTNAGVETAGAAIAADTDSKMTDVF